MLGKLIKYDLRATKFMWLIYAIAIGFAALMTVFAAFADFNNYWVMLILLMLLLPIYVVIVGVLLAPQIFIAVRFYKHMISDQAYLTFTLPVPRYYHIISKAITYAIWQTISVFTLILSFAMVFLGVGVANPELFDGFTEGMFMFDMTIEQLTPYMPAIIIVMIIYYFVSLFTSPMFIFASFSWGQAMIKKHRILGAFLSYLIISSITGFVMGAVSIITELVAFFNAGQLSTIGGYMQYMTTTYAIIGLIELALGIVAYIITNYCMTKKLNLE